MAHTTVLVMVDGLDPQYLASCPAPNFKELAKKGFQTEVRAMMPTVTNVNNTSLVTNSYPESHGITSNYWLDRESGSEHYMESGEYIQNETMFQRATRQGARSLLISSKDKLRKLLGDGATLAFSSEEPDSRVVAAIGQPPPVYSLEVNGWIMDAARHILTQENYDLVYLTTTDYAMHTYAPEQPESSDHLALLDRAVGLLMESLPDAEILITADHGMSSKSRMIHLPAELERHGIQARAVPIIKDLYTVHHSNLGGCIYLYLDERDRERALGTTTTWRMAGSECWVVCVMDAASFERVYDSLQEFHAFFAASFWGRKQWRDHSGNYLALLVQDQDPFTPERNRCISARAMQRFLTEAPGPMRQS